MGLKTLVVVVGPEGTGPDAVAEHVAASLGIPVWTCPNVPHSLNGDAYGALLFAATNRAVWLAKALAHDAPEVAVASGWWHDTYAASVSVEGHGVLFNNALRMLALAENTRWANVFRTVLIILDAPDDALAAVTGRPTERALKVRDYLRTTGFADDETYRVRLSGVEGSTWAALRADVVRVVEGYARTTPALPRNGT